MTATTNRPSDFTGDHAVDTTRRLSTETKAAFKTTEFIAYVVSVVGVIVTSLLVKVDGDHEDYFRADKAMFYIVLLTIGYMVARGFAKSGSPDRYSSDKH
jgi:hypothetical protein